MHPPLKFSGIRRSVTAIACTAAIVISAGCGDSSSPKLGISSPNQTLQTASVEPTPEETAVDQRAWALLAQMTLGEKVDMMHGESNNFYGFHNAPIPRLGIPALTMADGPMGVRIAHPDVNGQRATRLRSGLALAAIRDIRLAEQYGKLMGEEAHSTGHKLIRQVAAANPNTIVVMTAAGAVQTSDWEDRAPAVLHAWYGGQEQGNAIARILFGDVSPSGKLPVTMPVDDTKTPISTPEQFPGTVSQDVADQQDQQLTEGIFVGYRGYEQFNIQPQYPFGHGLSYTTFAYSNLRTTPTSVTVNVTNSGEVAGSEIVQVYAGKLPTPLPTAPKSLAGFAKVALQPGQSHDVTIPLAPRVAVVLGCDDACVGGAGGQYPDHGRRVVSRYPAQRHRANGSDYPCCSGPGCHSCPGHFSASGYDGPRGVGGSMKLLSTSFPLLHSLR